MSSIQGATMSANSASPSGCASHSASRQRRWASSQGSTTSTGSTTPMSPLASTPKPQKAQASSKAASDRAGCSPVPGSTARTAASTAALMQAATPMS